MMEVIINILLLIYKYSFIINRKKKWKINVMIIYIQNQLKDVV